MLTDDGQLKYGEIVVIGTNGHPFRQAPQRNNLFELFRAEFATAVMASRIDINNKSGMQQSSALPTGSSAIGQIDQRSRDAVIKMETGDKEVVVTCTAVLDKDMFQLGRQIDSERVHFTVDQPPSAVPADGTSTVSRYACRIIINRKRNERADQGHDPFHPRIFAAAFDAEHKIFLGQHASVFELPATTAASSFAVNSSQQQFDGFTTNGVLVLRPPSHFTLASASLDQLQAWQPQWLEVSVGGKMFKVGDRRLQPSPNQKPEMTEDTNYLPDGTIIDLCGVMLLWRSHTSLNAPLPDVEWLRQALSTESPSSQQQNRYNNGGKKSKRIISCISFGAISCGLPNRPNGGFNPQVDELNEDELDCHPYVYMGCGHVVTRRRMDDHTMLPNERCPITKCNKTGPLTQLQFSLEPRFFVDGPPATHCFKPCGHLVTEKTALVWSKIKPPRDPLRAICPFCARPLDEDEPYIKLVITYDNDDDDDEGDDYDNNNYN